MPIKDLVSKRFERLLVIGIAGRDKNGRVTWLCRCNCGVEKVIDSRHLVNNATRSCGCLNKEHWAEVGRKTGLRYCGSNSHLYKPELSDEDRAKWRDKKVKEWRREIFKRDDYTCQICKERGISLAAHHLNCWSSFPDERFDLENGITLCANCHSIFHFSLGGWSTPCIKEDFLLFKKNFVV